MLTWASLLLLVLYSPFGSPELYKPKKYFNEYQGVTFYGREILNAPLVKTANKNFSDFSVPDFASQPQNTYSISNLETDFNSSNGHVSSIYTENVTSHQTTQGSGLDVGGIKMSGIAARSNRNNLNIPNSGLLSQTTDLALLADDNLTRQGAGNAIPFGGTADPGSDALMGDPIPIPDGWGFLLVLSLAYLFIKRFLLRSNINASRIHN